MTLPILIIVFLRSFTDLSEVVMEFLIYLFALAALVIAWYVYSSFFVFSPFDTSYLVETVISVYP